MSFQRDTGLITGVLHMSLKEAIYLIDKSGIDVTQFGYTYAWLNKTRAIAEILPLPQNAKKIEELAKIR